MSLAFFEHTYMLMLFLALHKENLQQQQQQKLRNFSSSLDVNYWLGFIPNSH
jgi:hypothetical protein